MEVQLRSDATYIIPGGMGGLGRPLLKWMADKGARYLVATSRSGAKDPRAQQVLSELAALGVKAKAFAADVGDKEQCQNVLEEIAKEGFPRICGAVIMAMNVKVRLEPMCLRFVDMLMQNSGLHVRNNGIRCLVVGAATQAQRNMEHA